MKKYTQSPLHIWCVTVDVAHKEKEADLKMKNYLACDMIVTNAIHVFKDPCGSSRDFVKLNNKDALNPNLEFGEKNDGAQILFELRNIVFEKLNDKIRAIIKEVHTISTTLDKITTGSTSYTVIITYFFYQHLFRNKTVLCAPNK